jgi:hypothetical protein
MTHGGGVKMAGIDDSWKPVFLTSTNWDMRQGLEQGIFQ